MFSSLSNIRIAGVAVSTGSVTRDFIADGLALDLARTQLERISQTVGLKERKVTAPGITALDLCEDAARRLLDEMGIDASAIDAVIFVTQTPDHSQPNNSSLLHGRLGLCKSTAAFDLAMGCSGWVYGLHQAALLCAHGGAARVLLCAGDTLSRLTNPLDRATDPLFGDAGSAALIEKTGHAPAMHFNLEADGSGAKSICVPAGGARLPATPLTKQEIKDAEGNIHHAENLQMNGSDVFNFTLREVPGSVASVLKMAGWTPMQADALILHQANRFMVSTIGKKCGFAPEKTPMDSVEKFGNQSSASIPCTLIHALGAPLQEKTLKVVACGYGVGLSWGSVALELGPLVVAPLQSFPKL